MSFMTSQNKSPERQLLILVSRLCNTKASNFVILSAFSLHGSCLIVAPWLPNIQALCSSSRCEGFYSDEPLCFYSGTEASTAEILN